MKAVLVMEMPERCGLCPIKKEIRGTYDYCYDGRRLPIETLVSDSKLKGCPVKQMQQKQKHHDEIDYDYGFIDGWNACVEEIENESDNNCI